MELRTGVEDGNVGGRARFDAAGFHAEYARRVAGYFRERFHKRHLRFGRPFQGQRQQQLEAGRADFGFAERHLLGVLVHRRVIRADQVDRAVREAGSQRVAIARAAQRRHEMAMRIEIAQVHLGEVDVVDAYIAGHRQLLRLGLADHLHRARGGDPAHMQPRACLAYEFQQFAQRDRFSHRGYARQPQARRHLAIVRNAISRKRKVLGAQPDREAESTGVLECPPQHLRVVERNVRLRKGHAPGFGELGHLGQPLAGKLYRERTNRVQARVGERLRPPSQHIDQARLVQRRIGIRRAGDAGDAAGDGGLHLGLERSLVFESRFPQPRADIHQTRGDDEPFRIDNLVGARVLCAGVERRDTLAVYQHVANCVPPACRIDDASTLDQYFHQFPAMMLMTAMRTAIPNVTCGRITECGPSATEESISTPRFIGPGCITIESGLARASFSALRP